MMFGSIAQLLSMLLAWFQWTLLSFLQFATAEAARTAFSRLNGTDICGESLSISLTDPLHNERNSKRPRVAV